jgi:hypothetical protein
MDMVYGGLFRQKYLIDIENNDLIDIDLITTIENKVQLVEHCMINVMD